MDSDYEDTQPATQQLPAHNGVAPSDSAGQDFSGIICFLHPCSAAALQLVRHAQRRNPSLIYQLLEPQVHPVQRNRRAQTQGRYNNGRRVDIPPEDNDDDDDDADMEATQVDGQDIPADGMSVDLALRYEPGPRDPKMGFLFGRNSRVCDVVLADPEAAASDPEAKRVSNVHFRLYVNEKAALMLEDLSTNGTWVDHKRLHRGGPDGRKRVLSPGSTIMICPGGETFIRFVVRIPRSGGHGLRSVRAGSESSEMEDTMLPQQMPSASPLRIAGPEAATPGRQRLPPRNLEPMTNVIAPPRNHIPPRHNFKEPFNKTPVALRAPPPVPIKRNADSHTSVRPAAGMVWSGDGDYSLGEQIGKGAFASVHRAHERTTGDAVAVKIIAKRNFAKQVGNQNQGVQKEVEILEKLKHPNIVRYVDCFEDTKNVYLVMEYIELGDLSTYLNEHGTMEESLTKVVSAQILHGIEYIHSMGISHRDLKPDNILISQMNPMQIKISDFGLAKMIQNENTFLKTFCGTMLYLAPEVFPAYIMLTQESRPYDGAEKRKRAPNDEAGRKISKKDRKPYNQAVDMWSFGCVTFALLTGAPPFEGKNQDEMFKMVTEGRFDEQKLRHFVGQHNNACVDFHKRVLQVRPELRMMEMEALKHEWLRDSSMVSSQESMEYDEDEVAGVGYEPSGYGLRIPNMDVDDQEDYEDDEDVESYPQEIESHPHDEAAISSSGVFGGPQDNVHIQNSMAQMVVGKPRLLNRRSTSSESSGQDDFESVINSTNEVSQGNTGLSVIDRENGFRVRGRMPSSVGDMGDGSDAVYSGDDDAQSAWPNDYSLHGSDFSSIRKSALGASNLDLYKLNVQTTTTVNVNGHPPDDAPVAQSSQLTTPPRISTRRPPNDSIGDQNFNANFSPESLANPSPATTPITTISVQHTTIPPHPADADLPPTQPTSTSFLTPAIPWGKLHPLPTSLPHDTITLSGPGISVGRSLSCAVVESDERISKQHVQIQMHLPHRAHSITNPPNPLTWKPTDQMVVTINALSTNGVWLNGTLIKQRSAGMLCDGDELVLFDDKKAKQMLGFRVELGLGLVKQEDRARFTNITAGGELVAKLSATFGSRRE